MQALPDIKINTLHTHSGIIIDIHYADTIRHYQISI